MELSKNITNEAKGAEKVTSKPMNNSKGEIEIPESGRDISEARSLDLNRDTASLQQEEGEVQFSGQMFDDKGEEEDENMTISVQEVSTEGDLSPRHTKDLKSTVRRGRLAKVKTGHINTRSSSARSLPSK